MIQFRVAGLLMVSTLALAACGKPPAVSDAGAGPNLIITGGPILTMEGPAPTHRRGRCRRRRQDRVLRFAGRCPRAEGGDATVVMDLAGKTLMPGFIDGHAHGQQFGMQAIGANLLAPPDGDVNRSMTWSTD